MGKTKDVVRGTSRGNEIEKQFKTFLKSETDYSKGLITNFAQPLTQFRRSTYESKESRKQRQKADMIRRAVGRANQNYSGVKSNAVKAGTQYTTFFSVGKTVGMFKPNVGFKLF